MDENEECITESILNEFDKLNIKAAKMYVSITVLMVRNLPSKGEDDENPETSEFYILSTSALYTHNEIPEFLDHVRSAVNSRLENTQKQLQGSGWIFGEILKYEVTICKFAKGILGHHKPFPHGLRGSHHIFNPRSSENCVLISLASFVFLKPNPNIRPCKLAAKIHRNSRKFWQDRINIGSLNSDSIGWESLSDLENLNKVSFIIYSLSKQNHDDDKYCIQLVHHSRSNYEKVHLLLLDDDHICLIKNLPEFYRSFINRRSPISNLCFRCLTIFEKEEDCNNHTSNCSAQTTIEYAQPGERVGFQKVNSLYPHPYVCFLDFESFNQKLDSNNVNSQQVATQHAFAYKYCLINVIDKQNPVIAKEKTYYGMDCVNDMLTSLTNDWNTISSTLKYPINFSEEDRKRHNEAKKCSICKRRFNKTDRKKIKRHFHYLKENNYAGSFCNACDLKLRTPHFLPVVIHNLSYDLSLMLKEYDDERFEFKVNKKDEMRFYSASVGKLKFVDSCNMLKGHLSDLATHHILNKGNLSVVKESLQKYSTESQELLCNTGKQFLPYEYIDRMEKLQETSLPPIREFYSSLTNSHISSADYQHAQAVWEKAECRTLLDYVDLYLNLNVAFLADIYLQRRCVLMDLFNLDCLYFLTLASFAVEAMYHKCQVSLDLISDPNLYHIINRNIRGGFCSVGQRHVIANNKDTNPNFDHKSMKSNYLLYIDFNSLYPTVMSQFELPMGDFVELNGEELSDFKNQDLTEIDVEGDTGYYIYCNIKPISPEVIEKTDSYPLLISPMNIQNHHLSNFSQDLLREKNLKLANNNTKLVAHHSGVDNYLITLPLLQFLIKQGVEVSVIHKVIKFKQGFLFKHFIDENIRMRAEAANPFIKNALKLVNSAICGGTLLNPLDDATEVEICHDENSTNLIKSFSQPTFRKVDVMNEDRFLVTFNRPSVKASSPIYVGYSILDHAKLYMYKFWYSTIVPTYGQRAQFVYSDTDSFIINIETDDIVKEIQGPLAKHLDLSNFPLDHPLYSNKCMGELGKLKIETAPYHIKEFVALKPKAYSYTTTESDQVCHNTLKGVPKHGRNNLNVETYKECLYSNTRISQDISNLRFYNSNMSPTKNSQIILSSFEDKRYYVDGLNSYGYGHHKIINSSRVNKGDQSPPEEREKRKRNPDENSRIGLPQKKKKIGTV